MQKFKVELIGVFTKKDMPDEYESFVSYKANMDNIELTDDIKFAIVKI